MNDHFNSYSSSIFLQIRFRVLIQILQLWTRKEISARSVQGLSD